MDLSVCYNIVAQLRTGYPTKTAQNMHNAIGDVFFIGTEETFPNTF